MPINLHAIITKAFISAVCLAALPATGCAVRSMHGADNYFEGKALELAIASENGDARAIHHLIHDEGIDPDNTFSKEGGIPLVAWPLRAQNLEGLKALLENGADPNARLIENINGKPVNFNNALIYAVRMEDPRYLELLLSHGGNPNTRSSGGESLLFQAFINGNKWNNIQLLVEKGANINESNIGEADTVLGWYTARGGFNFAYWLLEHGADPTPIYYPSGGLNLPPRQMIVEEIYWGITTPDLLQWQKKCQQWLINRNITRPPMPEHIRSTRKAFGFPTEEKDIPLL